MPGTTADLILKRANIITCEAGKPAAQAIAVKGDKFLWLGSSEEAEQFSSAETKSIDCRGKTITPGFIDAHCHILAQARGIFSLDLSPGKVRSIADIQEGLRSKTRSAPPGVWISGRDYNEFYLAEKRHPTRLDLDAAAPSNPVILVHRSMHASVLNSLALELVGIGVESEEPPGGMIERDLESGEPNGILYEMLEFVKSKINFSLSEDEMEWAIGEVNRLYLSLGITSLVDATIGNDFRSWQAFLRLKGGQLRSRLNMMFGFQALADFSQAGLSFRSGDENLRLGCIKVVLSETRGQLHPAQPALNQIALEASRRGFQLAIHVVQTSTVESAVMALEYAQRHGGTEGLRHRLEHCSECPPYLVKRLRKLKAVVVSQPPFIYFSGERYLSQVSPRDLLWLYPFKSWLEAGLIAAGSSDSPVVSPNPLIGIYAAATRKAESGQNVLAEEAVSRQQALQMYTLNAAYSTFDEKVKGSLAAGKLADLVVLNADPLNSAPERVKDIEVDMTMIGGKIVWEK